MVKYIITENMKGLRDDIADLIKRADNIEPVYRAFLPHYQESIKTAFITNGMVYGKRWDPLNKEYRKRKIRKVGNKNTLKYTDKLFNATHGGPGSYTDINKKYMVYGIDLNEIPYARIHQYGGYTGRNHAAKIPQRAYFANYTNNGFTPRAEAKLRELLLQHIYGQGAFKRGK